MNLAGWRRNRNRILRTLDVATFMKEQGCNSQDVAIIALHKARYEAMDIEWELREESKEWLQARGYKRLNGLPWEE